tara:strand:+ start:389 stop:826 length:438 start_codon:yes stop_codon:yes gene_type:complete
MTSNEVVLFSTPNDHKEDYSFRGMKRIQEIMNDNSWCGTQLYDEKTDKPLSEYNTILHCNWSRSGELHYSGLIKFDKDESKMTYKTNHSQRTRKIEGGFNFVGKHLKTKIKTQSFDYFKNFVIKSMRHGEIFNYDVASTISKFSI